MKNFILKNSEWQYGGVFSTEKQKSVKLYDLIGDEMVCVGTGWYGKF